MAFKGFPAEAVTFYEGLGADNSRAYWQAHKDVYAAAVRGPMEDLVEELRAFGPFHIFRPNRDVRFAKDKTPYKQNVAAFGEGEGGAGFYVHFSASGMYAGSGYYHMASDQLERFRGAVDDGRLGPQIAAIVADLERAGLQTTAMDTLKTAPRGYPKDHPRIALLRRKGLVAGREWPLAKWMHTKAVVGRVADTWRATVPMTEWLDAHVGPSTVPPDEDRWRR